MFFYVSESTEEKMYDIPSPKIPFFKFLFVVIISPPDEGPGGMYIYIDICKGSLSLKGKRRHRG